MSQTPAAGRATRGMHLIVDASVVLAFYLPAEPLKARALELLEATTTGRLTLGIPTLGWYEILNALSRVTRGLKKAQRISMQQAEEIVDAIAALELHEHGISGLERRIFGIAVRHDRTAYDASYLALAEALDVDLVTGDQVFHRSVRSQFPRVKFLGDYQVPRH